MKFLTHVPFFQVVFTARCNPTWKSAEELLAVNEADLAQLYVLYEFIGEVFDHLNELKCRLVRHFLYFKHQNSRVIGPLVVIQSHLYRLTYPMFTGPTWAQSLKAQVVTAYGFDELDVVSFWFLQSISRF